MLPFFEIGMKTDLFQSLQNLLVKIKLETDPSKIHMHTHILTSYTWCGLYINEYWSNFHFLLQGIVSIHGLHPLLLHWQADSLPLSHLGNPADCMDLCKFSRLATSVTSINNKMNAI